MQNDYWKRDSEPSDSDKITEMYTPEPASEDSKPDDQKQSVVIENAPVHWSALEYIDNEKNAAWYVGFFIVVAALIAIDFFFIKSYTFSILVVVMAFAVIVFSRRPARTIDYTLSGEQGLYIGERLYHFSEFKSFGLLVDKGQHMLILIPIKRFLPAVTVYFPEEVGEEVVDIFGARLPMEKFKLDFVDIIARKLRL